MKNQREEQRRPAADVGTSADVWPPPPSSTAARAEKTARKFPGWGTGFFISLVCNFLVVVWATKLLFLPYGSDFDGEDWGLLFFWFCMLMLPISVVSCLIDILKNGRLLSGLVGIGLAMSFPFVGYWTAMLFGAIKHIP